MSSHFSDSRDVLPEPIHRKPSTRRRYATTSGRLTLLLLFVVVISLSCAGGFIANIDDLSDASYGFRGNDFLLCRMMEGIFGMWIFAVGSSVGSFLNVVAWRGPRGMSINGHSFCPRCNVPISSIDNIPIVGWLRLRGRCLTCRLPISAKYPIFEAISGFMFLILYVTEFLSHGANLPLAPRIHQEYGLPLNLTDLSARLVWMFAIHLILLSTMLAIFMTRNNGHQIPAKYLLFSAFLVWAVLLVEPGASNTKLLSLRISPAENHNQLAWHICRTAITSLFAACLLAVVQRFSQAQQVKDPTEGESKNSLISLICNWFLILLLMMLSIGMLPSLLILIVAMVLCVLSIFFVHNGAPTPLSYSQSWLVAVSYLFILGWKSIANATQHLIN